MRILALDTATEACSAALCTPDGIIGVSREVGRGHAEAILGMVDEVLAQAGLGLTCLDGIAASVGPGSFTGVRICVSVAQGLAFGASLPVVPVTTLDALAFQATRLPLVPPSGGIEPVLACLDARMGEVYWGCFAADAAQGVVLQGSMAVGAPDSVQVPFAGGYVGIGRGFGAYPTLAALTGCRLPEGAERALPDARDFARLGWLRRRAGAGVDPAELTPVYLRDKVALTEMERAALKRGPA